MAFEKNAVYGKYLIWLGLFSWVPYIICRVAQVEVPLIPFLSAHLIGVLGGSYLRRDPRQPTRSASKKAKILKTLSTVLILLGISAWGVYFGLEWITGLEREIQPFLIAHLSGVITGAGIKVYNFLSRK